MSIIKVLFAFFSVCVALSSAREISDETAESRENLRRLSWANNELAFNLYRRIRSRKYENVFFSPLSISTAFGMLLYGTRGNTAQELRKTLGYQKAGLPDHLVHETFNRFLREVLKSENSSTGCVLNAANAVLVDRSLELLEDYRNDVQELYRATVRDVDFSRDAPRIVDEINDWVREKTNGKITNLLHVLNPSSILVLLNAVYFKGTWKTEFDREETRDQIFYNRGSKGRRVPLMHMRKRLPFARFRNFQALELPYKGENVSMLILLPNEREGLQSIEQKLTHAGLAEIYGQLYRTVVEVNLPKFKVEYEKDIRKEMMNLGAGEIFTSGSANFSGMTPRRDVSVSQVLHKAVIEVDEEGSEAADVLTASSFKFTADHPFLFAIVERGVRSNMILFLGCVNIL